VRKATILTVLACLGAAFVALLGGQDKIDDSGFQSYAGYQSEQQAVEKGERLGIGRMELLGPSEAVVDTDAELRLRFTVGKAGLKTGGGIRIATGHNYGWNLWGGDQLQTTNPAAENYLTYKTSTGAPLRWKLYTGGGKNPLFLQYHPWQNINEFLLTGAPLQPGDFIEVRMGDRRGGSPGVRMQPMDEEAFLLKTYVDVAGDGDYLPLGKNPSIKILAASAKQLNVVVPSDWEAEKPGWVNVWLDDGYGNPAAGYRGTVKFESELPGAVLPPDYTFQPGDRGAHRFEGIRIPREGTYRIRVREKKGKLSGESNPFIVRRTAPKYKIYWGDIHTHTLYSDGRGTPAETYDFGKRVSAIDFCSVTDHAFLITDKMWREIIDTTNRYNQPGRYVTFLGYEWSGQADVGGDHNVYTPDPEMPLIRSYSYYNYANLRMYHGPTDAMHQGVNHVEELFRRLSKWYRGENFIAIPHYGGRHANPAWHNRKLQRQIEVFSDHRRSEDWASDFLNKGYRVGVMASTDDHSGNAGYGVRRWNVERGKRGEVYSYRSPAERGTALVAACAKSLTRKDVFQALYHRRTYATTGSRIILRFEAGEIPMGSEGRVSGPVRITASAVGTAPIKTMRIVKNGRVIHAVRPGKRSVSLEYVDSSGEYQNRFYYIDLVQEDGEKAISSPVWIN